MMRLGLITAAVVLALDQASKEWVLRYFDGVADGTKLTLTGFLDLVLTWNYGMSFGIFNTGSGYNTFLFTAFAAVIVAFLLVWLRRVQHPLLGLAIGLVIGGAVGNVLDRLRHGAVVDFLDFHLAQWHWYVFNLADAAICVGVGLMVIESLFGRREAPGSA